MNGSSGAGRLPRRALKEIPLNGEMQFEWCDALVVGEPCFLIGFTDSALTVPCISTLIYLGVGVLDDESTGKFCFQTASSHASALEREAEPTFFAIDDPSISMIADKRGLVRWLQSNGAGRGSRQP